MSISRIVIPLCCALLVGCNSSDEPNLPPDSAVLLDDGSANGPIVLLEQQDLTLRAAAFDRDGVIQSWHWSDAPIESGDLEVCHGAEDYNQSVVADSIGAACTSSDSCTLDFTQAETRGPTEVAFTVTAPQLQAPVGATYELTATDNGGATATTTHTFCLIAINEAPDAADDTFTVLEGSILVVNGSDRNLLSNDLDDIDATNAPNLRVLPDVVSAPLSASVFELRQDGGFSYAFAGGNLTTNLIDRFTYAVTDGLHTANAEVTLNIVAQDDPPVQLQAIPTLVATAGLNFRADLTAYFRDPENADLGFRLLNGSLPGAYAVGSSGSIEGRGTQEDAGSYSVTLGVSDGNTELTADLTLQVVDNGAVVARDIPEQSAIVGERVQFFMSPYFSDPESQPLRFALNVDSADAQTLLLTVNSQTGVVEGFVRRAGRYTVDIVVNDQFNESTRATLVINAQNPNMAPEFVSGTVADRRVRFGQQLPSIRPVFTEG